MTTSPIRVRAGQTWQHATDYNPRNRLTVYVYKVDGDQAHVITADQHTGRPVEGGRKRTINLSYFRTTTLTRDGIPWKTGYLLKSESVSAADLIAEAARAAERAVADHFHTDLCGCDHWPRGCRSRYTAHQWDSGQWETGLPAALAVLGVDLDTLTRQPEEQRRVPDPWPRPQRVTCPTCGLKPADQEIGPDGRCRHSRATRLHPRLTTDDR